MARPKGGTELPVEGVLSRMSRGIRYALTGNDWFGPGAPIPASAPESVEGRQFSMPVGINQLNQTKTEGVSFHTLRTLAYSCDIVRLLIETRKDQLCALDWTIQKKNSTTSRGARKAGLSSDKIADTLTAFFTSPDKEHDWPTWLRFLLEDMFVLDAPTLYIQRTRGGDLYALRPVDGATIKRIIDTNGWTPLPPDPAYQQILHGVQARNYTTQELLYRPRNPRTNHVYGYSHVEQIIVTVRTYLERQASNLEYYEEGTTPDGFLSASASWDAKQIALYQKLFDEELTGQLGARRKVKITPHDSKFTQTKEPAMKNDYDEWLVRIACFCFSIPPTAFTKETNRATAGTTNIASLETGLSPDRQWVERYTNFIIQNILGQTDYEFKFRDKEAEDPLERASIDQIYLTARDANGVAVLTANEVREDLGLDPLPESAKTGVTSTPPEPPDSNNPPNADKTGSEDETVMGNQRLGKSYGFDVSHLHQTPKPETPAEKRLAVAFENVLAVVGKSVAAQWEQEQLIKVDESDQSDQKKAADKFAAGVDLSDFKLVWDDYSGELIAVAQDGSKEALVRVNQVNPGSVTPEMLDRRDARAVEWATDHAAEMISKDGDGGALLDSTRSMIRNVIVNGLNEEHSRAEIGNDLVNSYGFSKDRAALIATTEVRNAEGAGLLAGYKVGGLTEKRWLLSNDEGICQLCEANAEQGFIPIDQGFVSGAQAPLQHPNCRCGLTAR